MFRHYDYYYTVWSSVYLVLNLVALKGST
jgi:hypothetical protein